LRLRRSSRTAAILGPVYYSRAPWPTRRASSSPIIEIDVSIIALSFVKQGLGVALVDGLLPWESFPGLVVRPLHPPTSLPICLLTSTRRPLSRNHEFLRHALRRAVAEEACDPTGPSRLLPA
jgi:DNA-binding transcriptional LysR family regulator